MQPTQALQRSVKRLTLTTKQTGKGFYKGTGSGSMGNHTKYGTYKIQWSKVRTYVAPDLSSFELTPFVTKTVKQASGRGRFPDKLGPLSGKLYLEKWKAENGQD
ncbi:Ribosomal protein L27/L41 mitochondrial [Lasiodiplodia theobromae]|uniref:54S ribosomal protein L27 n=1 Tax=Lasiodiplodia theobromae TaxID=45133 RepID=A0A5N5DRJ9_9PEZI|nr:Ribosomal protein L27/L41 mitochondrial [Lasiodiplodia theobromae]KAB2579502.1 54S ribosomal protein L27 [Lasiodiplodia theobromae]KAF4542221.1 Ribosomal protein L27/L41 mitochondrial [Lasiodiplodia theobromae]